MNNVIFEILKSNLTKNSIEAIAENRSLKYSSLDCFEDCFNLGRVIAEEINKRNQQQQEQQQIAKILSSLDDKIELNTQINHNLEEQAKAIFKSWFVDFSALEDHEFYDNNGLCAPVGWDISCLSNMADYLNGLAMQKDWPSFVTHGFQS